MIKTSYFQVNRGSEIGSVMLFKMLISAWIYIFLLFLQKKISYWIYHMNNRHVNLNA